MVQGWYGTGQSSGIPAPYIFLLWHPCHTSSTSCWRWLLCLPPVYQNSRQHKGEERKVVQNLSLEGNEPDTAHNSSIFTLLFRSWSYSHPQLLLLGKLQNGVFGWVSIWPAKLWHPIIKSWAGANDFYHNYLLKL